MKFPGKPAQIKVVAPDKYAKIARQMAHFIARDKKLKSSYWSIQTYLDNEFKNEEGQYVILIGDQEENEITNEYFEVFNDIKDRAGSHYGFDGSKAIIFGAGNLEEEVTFYNTLTDIKSDGLLDNTIAIPAAILATFLLPPIGIIMGFLAAAPLVGGLIANISVYFVLKTDKSSAAQSLKLKEKQTKAAAGFYLTEMFDEWVGINEE